PQNCALEWLCTGWEIFPAMLKSIADAKKSIRLETYIYADGKLGKQFLEALTAAAQRGVSVQVLVDAVGSWFLANDFFKPLTDAGGEVRRFNPFNFWRFGVRNHRKLLVCDGQIAFIGGFNIADEYDGDGVKCGWCDVGAKIENPSLIEKLALSFDQLFSMADFHRRPLLRLRAFKRPRKGSRKKSVEELLLMNPGVGKSPFQFALHNDLQGAKEIQIISAYFLPTRRLRRDLRWAAKRGARVRLILAGKSDVPLSRLAAQHYYRRLLRAGVEIYEYQPQILHAKLMIADGAVYVGSANLDIRSLNLNYEVMLRLKDETVAVGARNYFEHVLKHCRRVELGKWQKSQTLWTRWKSYWAHLLLRYIDPYVALKQFHAVKK
ncbi:MAG TPA: phosphatidylserine/phosphatidylglycerophosphate/cardiolipin synthase family protein, partial [Candidatus Baltobacteraceae bacterium]|nr:phosphatidylserine/phosphatidylglycerophosphate/cardiolipin synthase family protein [Candidatus Baltobacteraceae bacterium]